MLPVSWDPYRRDPAELALLERVAAERRREADSYRRRRITSLMPTSKKGRAKKAMPAHLQVGAHRGEEEGVWEIGRYQHKLSRTKCKSAEGGGWLGGS